MNLSRPFINRPVMTTLLMIGILCFGILSFRAMPVSDLPNIDYPTITVEANQPGGSPEYMANTVAIPLERNFATISGLRTMTSSNTLGSTTIVLNFDIGTDLNSKEVEVQAAITETLPNLPPMPTNPTFSKTNPSNFPILIFFLSSKTVDLAQLYEYGYNVIAQPLSMIEGISQVRVYGYPYAVRVQVDPMKLASYNMDLNETANLLIEANPNLASGTLQGAYQNLIIETKGQVSDGNIYNKIILKDVNGFPLKVENIGTAINALEDRYPYFHYIQGERDESVVVLVVNRLPGSNTLNISKEIFKQLPELKNAIPDSTDFLVFYNQATTILSSVEDVEVTLLIAIFLVVLVIFVYLGSLLDTLIPTAVIPLALLATFIVMFLLGFSIDILSLLSLILAIGFVVDDSIVVMENIVRQVEMGKTPFQAAMDGSKQISVTVFTMTLALTSVFIPMIWMPGILGKMFNEFAVTIVVAILCSGFISLTLNPMLCSRFLRQRNESNEGPKESFSQKINHFLVTQYLWLLAHSIRYKKTILFIGCACLMLSYFLYKHLPADFLPSGNLSLLEGLVQNAEGSSSLYTIEHQKKVNEVLKANRYQDGFVTITGYPSIDQGFLFIRLLSPNQRPNSTALSLELMEELDKIPGANTFIKPVPLINLQVGSTTSLGQYQYVLEGIDADVVYKHAELMVTKMSQMPELVGVNSDMKTQSPQLNVTIDRDRAGVYGITAEAIESVLQYAYAGGRISTFNKGSNLYDLILEVMPGYDLTSKDLDLLYVKSSISEEMVPLTSIATWKEVAAPSTINHINIFPSVTISFGLAPGVSIGEALEKIYLLAQKILPKNIFGKVQGSAQVFEETFESMGYLFFISILVMYLLLGILYESFIHPITILSALPVALFGGLITLVLFNEPLSLYSVVGLIVLVGLVQKNGIMMIDFALEELQKPKITIIQAITEACKIRFRPIIMTSLAAIMGSIPIAIGIGENGSTNRPLGLVVVGGLIFSQLITLFVTPVVFIYMQEFQEWLTKRKNKI